VNRVGNTVVRVLVLFLFKFIFLGHVVCWRDRYVCACVNKDDVRDVVVYCVPVWYAQVNHVVSGVASFLSHYACIVVINLYHHIICL
jgi:hypothetical protein